MLPTKAKVAAATKTICAIANRWCMNEEVATKVGVGETSLKKHTRSLYCLLFVAAGQFVRILSGAHLAVWHKIKMSWERRGNQKYYFRASRCAGKIVKQYLGRGERAVAAAKEDSDRRAARIEQVHAELERRQAYEILAERVTALGREAAGLVAANLVAAGFHRPRRKPWRRRRATKTKVS